MEDRQVTAFKPLGVQSAMVAALLVAPAWWNPRNWGGDSLAFTCWQLQEEKLFVSIP